jgi:hypothetical protein
VPNVSSAANTIAVAATKAKVNVSVRRMDSFPSGNGIVTPVAHFLCHAIIQPVRVRRTRDVLPTRDVA